MITGGFTNFVVPNWAINYKASTEEGRSKVKFDFKVLECHNLRSFGQGKRGVSLVQKKPKDGLDRRFHGWNTVWHLINLHKTS